MAALSDSETLDHDLETKHDSQELTILPEFVTFLCENCDETKDLSYCKICNDVGDDKGARILCSYCGEASHTQKDHNFGDTLIPIRGWGHSKKEIEKNKKVI